MARSRTLQTLSKMLTYVLARRPDEFGLVPDADGYVKIKDLLKALHEDEGLRYVTYSHLAEVILSVPEAPIEISENRIRARSRETLPPTTEAEALPKVLFTAIRRRAYEVVLERGVQAADHARIVMTPSREVAERLGKRIDSEPVILTVLVQSCRNQGVTFEQAGAGLFLADLIPPGGFSAPPLPLEKRAEARPPAKPADTSKRSETPGSFVIDSGDILQSHALGYRRLTAKGKKIDPKRFKREKWLREKPPWRE
ncbi:MAG: RNA 2'-phosphotransferase [Desulfobacterales bacterium]|nr:RNA 2'-phosphotransferase [Desulfobacterales bacterium]